MVAHFADNILSVIFLNENVWIPIEISLKFVPKGPINKIPSLVQIMAWRRSGVKPLSEPMMDNLLTHICFTRPQWVNISKHNQLFITRYFIVFHESIYRSKLASGIFLEFFFFLCVCFFFFFYYTDTCFNITDTCLNITFRNVVVQWATWTLNLCCLPLNKSCPLRIVTTMNP